MYNFSCDYLEGAHSKILDALVKTNYEQTPGYTLDYHTKNAISLIKKACENEDIFVHFVVGGTQANIIVISSLLKPYQGVICAEDGHINVHETGAIESTGHKVLALHTNNGKLTSNQIKKYIETFKKSEIQEHIVEPGMIYISYPTERGLIYSKEELSSIYCICKEYNIPLYIDGARLGYGLMSKSSDISLKDLPNLCDVFYIGGTKLGALFGEAIITKNDSLNCSLRPMIKQHGAMFAKGRLLGIQFEELFKNDLYFKGAMHGIQSAEELCKVFTLNKIKFRYPPQTNQIFVVLNESQINKLNEGYIFEIWDKLDNHEYVVRFATSWATDVNEIKKLASYL